MMKVLGDNERSGGRRWDDGWLVRASAAGGGGVHHTSTASNPKTRKTQQPEKQNANKRGESVGGKNKIK